MHRLLVDGCALGGGTAALPEASRHHLKVLRPKEGEKVELFDGCGAWRVFEWKDGTLCAAGEIRRAERPVRRLWLFACVTKGSRWDWTIEKATELGVSRIVPVISARTIVRVAEGEREAKRARWTRVAEDAARQSDAKWLPEVLAPVGFAEAVRMAAECECYVGALSDPPPQDVLTEVLRGAGGDARSPSVPARSPGASGGSPRPLAVFVGPEGDFTPEELAAVSAAATPVGFGPTILRAETAAIYGLSVLKAFMDSHQP